MAIFGEKTCSPSTWMNLAFQYLILSVILKKTQNNLLLQNLLLAAFFIKWQLKRNCISFINLIWLLLASLRKFKFSAKLTLRGEKCRHLENVISRNIFHYLFERMMPWKTFLPRLNIRESSTAKFLSWNWSWLNVMLEEMFGKQKPAIFTRWLSHITNDHYFLSH